MHNENIKLAYFRQVSKIVDGRQAELLESFYSNPQYILTIVSVEPNI